MRVVKLGFAATVISGQHILKDDHNETGQGIGYLTGPADFGSLKPKITRWTLKPKVTCEPGDILITVKGAGVGKINLSPDNPVAIGRQLMAIRVDTSQIETDFLFLFLLTHLNYFQNISVGATVPGLSRTDLEMLNIPCPSIEKQRQLSARLKAQLKEVEKARQAAQMQLHDTQSLATRYKENALKLLCETQRVPLGELLNGIEAGKSFQTTELQAKPNELGVLKVSAVSWNKFMPDEAKAIEKHYKPDEKHRVKKGDLIISRANTLELVGSVVKVTENYPLRLLSDKTLRLLVNEKKVKPDYLLHILKWPEARTHIENNATGSSDSMRNISQKTIKTIPIPLPPLDRQFEIVTKAEKIDNLISQVEDATNKQKNDLKILPKKLLSQAFEIKA